MLIDLIKPTSDIPPKYKPSSFSDINGVYLLEYDETSGALRLNRDQVDHDLVKAIKSQLPHDLEVHILGVENPVYFPNVRDVEYLPKGLDVAVNLIKAALANL